MRIVKIYNNNAVETKDTDCREIIVVGCGLAFKKGWGTKLMILKYKKSLYCRNPV